MLIKGSKRLAISLIFIWNLQLITGFSFFLPISSLYPNTDISPLLADSSKASSNPIVYENSGIDQYGYPFYQKEMIQSYGNIDFNQEPNELPFKDYFQDSEEQQESKQDIQYINRPFKDVFGNIGKQFMDLSQENIPMEEKKNKPWIGLLKQSRMDFNEPSFEFLKPESAMNFKFPGLKQFHLIHHDNGKENDNAMMNDQSLEELNNQIDLINDQEENLENLSEGDKKSKYQFVLKPSKIDDDKILVNREQEKIRENAIKIEKLVQKKENDVLKTLHGEKLVDEKDIVDSYIYIELDRNVLISEAEDSLKYIATLASFPFEWIKDISVKDNLILFKAKNIDLDVLCSIIEKHKQLVSEQKGLQILSCRRGHSQVKDSDSSKQLYNERQKRKTLFIATIAVCASVLCILIILLSLFVIKRKAYLRQKLMENVSSMNQKKHFDDSEQLIENASRSSFMSRIWPFKTKQANEQQSVRNTLDYTDLCRSTKLNNQISPLNNTETTNLSNRCDNFDSPMNGKVTVNSTPISTNVDERKTNESNRSSASSWSEEPISSLNVDITTGHAILSYMEDHLNDKNRLNKEWEELSKYEVDQNDVFVGSDEKNMPKNRYADIIPYDHNRVKLEMITENGNDYINASFITDDDPKNPAYIATQGPLKQTTCDFWQMVWEQNSVIIVSLCRIIEYGSSKCNQYWPSNGFENYGNFEVHLVSEHVWCEDYLVRSFYLKNKTNNQTRTVTQFQFLTWPENSIPPNIKAILDFRRKVNKSYNRKSFPIIVHCNDGIGRTANYILIDMILNKIVKETREIDLAATSEYLKDQRKGMIKNKNQFEFSFTVITEEVQNMLKMSNK